MKMLSGENIAQRFRINNLSPFEEKCSELITQQSVEENKKKNHHVREEGITFIKYSFTAVGFTLRIILSFGFVFFNPKSFL